MIALIIGAPGCRSVELLVSHEDPGRLAIVETWDSIEAHQASILAYPPDLLQEGADIVPLRQPSARTTSPCRKLTESLRSEAMQHRARELPMDAAAELQERGFVVIPGPVPSDR